MFHYKHEPEGPIQYGLIAEEVEKIYPQLVTRNARGEVQGVRYDALIPLLLNEVQEQHRRLETQARQLDAQAEQMRGILQQLAELREQNERLQAAMRQGQEAERPAMQISSAIPRLAISEGINFSQ